MKSSLSAVEANFDGLVGPTHNYAGLAPGNLASQSHQNTPSNPKLAAQQGLAKMKALADRGFAQAVLPPHQRPDVATLRKLGFAGDDAQVLMRAAREAPQLLAACSSAAAMWTANAATVSPSADTADGRVHFTPANLIANFHRSLESPMTARVLRTIFADQRHFAHHAPLPATLQFGDEGAANHTRLCADYAAPGIELFVYGRRGFDPNAAVAARFSARQTAEASRAVARLHDLRDNAVLIVQQAQNAIDQGVFHNDVIAVGNRNVLFCHEQAFMDTANTVTRLGKMLAGTQLEAIVVREDALSVAEAVETYLFNSQLLTQSDGTMLLVAPEECRRHARVWPYLQELLARGGAIREVLTFDLRESMHNGGGPACLRLRVVLTAAERAAIGVRVWLDDALHHDLTVWIARHYRDRLGPADLADPALLDESRRALDELTGLLRLGAIYPFQRDA